MASVRNLHDNLDRLETVLAVQLLTAAQAIDLITPKMTGLHLGAGTRLLQDEIRRHIAPLTDDRYMTPDLEKATALVRDRTLLPILRSRPADHANGRRLRPAA
jgi:histidine ammonia-lyase